jgi:hypothetical protein
LTKISTHFPSKWEMPSYMKFEFIDKLATFIKVDFEVFR